jgi:hypothetical protein
MTEQGMVQSRKHLAVFELGWRACGARWNCIIPAETEIDRWSPEPTVYANSGRHSIGPRAGSGDPRRTVDWTVLHLAGHRKILTIRPVTCYTSHPRSPAIVGMDC